MLIVIASAVHTVEDLDRESPGWWGSGGRGGNLPLIHDQDHRGLNGCSSCCSRLREGDWGEGTPGSGHTPCRPDKARPLRESTRRATLKKKSEKLRLSWDDSSTRIQLSTQQAAPPRETMTKNGDDDADGSNLTGCFVSLLFSCRGSLLAAMHTSGSRSGLSSSVFLGKHNILVQ